MVTNNSTNTATGASGTVLTGNGVGVSPTFQAAAGSIGGSTGGTDNSVLRADGTGGSTLQNSAASIDDSGNLIATSINFGAGTTLSNYAEGTFTPTLIGGSIAGVTTYTQQQGYYTRIGNMIMVQAYIGISAASGTGNVTLGGLPFTIKNQTNGYSNAPVFWQGGATWAFPAGSTSLSGVGIFNTTTILVYVSGTAVSGGFMQMANAALALSYTMMYQI